MFYDTSKTCPRWRWNDAVNYDGNFRIDREQRDSGLFEWC
jgi:hypothetical protein